MLDLLKLETLVDETLENETPNSLLEWLKIQRDGDIYSYLGNGNIERYSNSSSSSFTHGVMKPIVIAFAMNQSFDSYSDGSSNFTIAA